MQERRIGCRDYLRAAVAAIASATVAQGVTWNNTSSDFNAAGSWTGGSPAGTTAAFASAPTVQPVVGSDITIGQLGFTAVSGYAVSGAGKITMTTTTAILATNTTGTNTISAPLELGRAAGNTFSQSASGTLVISGKITQTNANTVLSLGGGSGTTFTLSNDNTYSGGTNISNSGIKVNIGSATALGSGRISIGANAPTFTNTSGGSLSIANGLQWTAATPGLNFADSNPLTISGAVSLHLSAGATTTFTVAGANNVVELSGPIGDDNASAGAKGITGASSGSQGTLVLSGNNTYAGTTVVGAIGKVRIKHNNALGSTTAGTTVAGSGTLEMEGGITVTGESLATAGILKSVGGSNTWAGPVTITGGACSFTSDAGTLTVSGNVNGDVANRPVTLSGASKVVVSGNLGSNVSTVAKSGGGTAELSGGNVYVSTTTVTAGTLFVNGTHTGGDSYSIGATGTLGGTGVITLAATKAIGVTGVLAPGGETTLDDLDVTGDVVVNNGGSLRLRANTSTSDRLDVIGSINLNGTVGTDVSRLDINGTPGSLASYVLATYSGSLTGVFDQVYFNNVLVTDPTVEGIGSYKLDYGSGANSSITLVQVPEPASLTALLLGAGMLLRRRR